MPRFFRTAVFRLSAFNGLAFSACLLVLLGASYWTATSVLRDQLRSNVQDEIGELFEDIDPSEIAIAELLEEHLKSPVGRVDYYYYLVDRDGHRLAGNLGRIDAAEGWQELPFDKIPTGPNAGPANEADDHQLWGLGTRLSDGSLLFVGQDAYGVISAQEDIVTSFGWSAGAAFLLAAVAGIVISEGFLRRIDAINKTSLTIMDGNLRERIPVRGTSDEIDRLSVNLNRLFDSNQALLESLKQVSANIAHDLRMPVSRLRQELEEARLRANDAASYESAVDAAIAESDKILAISAALLRIARIESGSRRAGFKQLDLTAIFERIADAYQPVAEDQSRVFDRSFTAGIAYVGDDDLLLQMLANLLENALQHTPAGTPISLSLTKMPDGAVAVIADRGQGIPAEFRMKVFERFYSLNSSRTQGGSGLGLALVSAVAALHGIAIELDDNRPGLRVTLRFIDSGS